MGEVVVVGGRAKKTKCYHIMRIMLSISSDIIYICEVYHDTVATTRVF